MRKSLTLTLVLGMFLWILPIGSVAAEGTDHPLVFHSLDAPCVVFDTRPAPTGSGAGPLESGRATDAMTFDIVGTGIGGPPDNFESQGGTPGGCGIPGFISGNPVTTAVLMNLVAINPTAGGNLRAYPTGATGSGGIVNFQGLLPANLNNSNAFTLGVRQDTQGDDITIEINAATGSTVQVRGILLGYFTPASHRVQHRTGYAGFRNNTIGGSYDLNTIAAGVKGATISGGGGHDRDTGCIEFGSIECYWRPNEVLGSFGTVGGGLGNTAGARGAVVDGGKLNTADGMYSAVGGGLLNGAAADYATVGGGDSNRARGDYTTIAGGSSGDVYDDWGTLSGGSNNDVGTNDADPTNATHATVSGGSSNVATGPRATIGGGTNNAAGGSTSTIGGGQYNSAGATDATVAGGYGNDASNPATTIAGGWDNSASASYATIGGGRTNTAINTSSTVSGGTGNSADGEASTVGGGASNTAEGDFSTVGGGWANNATGLYALVGGGGLNTASNSSATVAGGYDNSADGYGAFVAGGYANTATAQYSNIAGGESNTAGAMWASVGGGFSNEASNGAATVGGGYNNTASGDTSSVGGGDANVAGGGWATVPGGNTNTADGDYSLAAGRRAQALHAGSFVWADSSNTDFSSTAADQFLVNASGGVGINTGAPGRELSIGDGTGNGNAYLNVLDGTREILLGVDPAGGILATMTDHDLSFRTNNVNAVTITTGPNRYVGIGTTAPTHPLEMGSGAHVTTGGAWTNGSDAASKTQFAPVDAVSVLEAVADLDVGTWSYVAEDASIAHMGPTAQDFAAAFGLGASDTHITTIDADGVALAAIQGLYAQNQALQAQVDGLTPATGTSTGLPLLLVTLLVLGVAVVTGTTVALVTRTRSRLTGRFDPPSDRPLSQGDSIEVVGL